MQGLEELRDILADLQAELRRVRARADQSDLLLSGIKDLLSMPGHDDPFRVAFQALERLVGFDVCLALIEDGKDLICEAATQDRYLGRKAAITGPKRKALRGKTISALPQEGSVIDPEQRYNALYAPIRASARRGVLMLLREKEKGVYGKAEVALVNQFAVLTDQALSLRAQAETEARNTYLTAWSQELERQAHYDALTGLPNRTKIGQIVQERMATHPETPFSLAFIDVNKFKQINDYFGHDTGDQLLIEIARRLSAHLSDGDHLARISGDEFLLLLGSAQTTAAAHFALDRMSEAVNTQIQLGRFRVHNSISVGVSRFPQDSRDPDELRRHADSAMYRAKATPGGAIVHFDASMAQDITAKMELENRLRRAIDRLSFVPVFQPQIDIRSNCLKGFEVLLRWHDDCGELRAPDYFLALAEEMGLLNRITTIAVTKVAQMIPRIDARFGRDHTISVNIAAGQATNTAFLKELIDVLEPTGQLPRMLFEITEDAALEADIFTHEVMPLLQAHAIRIAIDDFGKGYSNLSALGRIQAYEVKIDRDFVDGVHADPARQRVLRMIEMYARSSGMHCVAEGAEQAEDVHFLRDHTEIPVMQGYFYARPMRIEELLEWAPDRAQMSVTG